MDDERLKNPNNPFGKDYFEEQLERIRDIHNSERRFYLKITDIFALCSADYKLDSEFTKKFLPPYKTNCIRLFRQGFEIDFEII